MLKHRSFSDCKALFEQLIHPDVFPYVREKAHSYEEYVFINQSYIERERQGEIISRVIVNEKGEPIGTISLFDIEEHSGFLGTWLGKEHHGKGYNQMAKEQFFHELFFEKGIETIYLKVRKTNIRSQMALLKLPYVTDIKDLKPWINERVNLNEPIYDVYEISRYLYELHLNTHYAEGIEA